jgi:uncharacterized membrane protein
MTESLIINAATVIRIVLVGGIMMVIPLVTRRGLLFGVYVGEEFSVSDEARRLVRQWNVTCVGIMAVSLVIGLGIALTGHALAGNVVGTVVLLLAFLALYLRMYYAARRLAPAAAARQAETSVAVLEAGATKGTTLAMIALAVCIVASLASMSYAMLGYPDMPDRVPTHFGASGEADAWSDKSLVSVLLLPTLNLVMSPFLALMALLTTRAKRSVRGGTGGRSIEAQNAFRGATANLLSGTALLTCTMMTYLSVQATRVALGQIRSLGNGIWWITGVTVVFVFGGLIWIIVRYGQGGAFVEQGSADAPLTDGIADNAHWVWGVFYVNKDDPSILVEKRWGVGYTINFGNRWAVLLMVGFLVVILGLALVGVLDASG